MHSFFSLLLLLLVACSSTEQVSQEFPPTLSPAPSPEVPVNPEAQDIRPEEVEEGAGRHIEDYFGSENGAEALAADVIGNGEESLSLWPYPRLMRHDSHSV